MTIIKKTRHSLISPIAAGVVLTITNLGLTFSAYAAPPIKYCPEKEASASDGDSGSGFGFAF
jgi:hypothetical protein